MKTIYLDNSAATPVFPEVTAYMTEVQDNFYGNPSSLHRIGLAAERVLKRARENVSSALGVNPEEIIFTSGGTEANNLAVKGTARRLKKRGNHIITTAAEHPSVLEAFKQLAAQEGFEVSIAAINQQGLVNPEQLLSMVNSRTILVSIIHTNNETGAIQPIAELCRLVKGKNPRTLIHADGVQSPGKVPLRPAEWNLDLLTLSAHKIHGPKGAGALWLRKGTLISPLTGGGDQEQGIRPGTENLPGIAGFGRAAEIYLSHNSLQKNISHLSALKTIFFDIIKSSLPVTINGPAVQAGAPHIINLLFPGVKGEVLVHALAGYGIYASPGSACHSRHPAPSHVLLAMGLDEEKAGSSLRFSFSVINTEDEVKEAAAKTITAVKELMM